VLAPNAPLRAAVTALAPEAIAAQLPPSVETSDHEPVETPHRSPARYLWAMLLARLYEVFPLTCPKCGTEMRIIAFVTEAAPVQRILSHIGEPALPPRIAPARGPRYGRKRTPGPSFSMKSALPAIRLLSRNRSTNSISAYPGKWRCGGYRVSCCLLQAIRLFLALITLLGASLQPPWPPPQHPFSPCMTLSGALIRDSERRDIYT